MPALDVENGVVSTILEVKTLFEELLVESETIKPIDIAEKASSNIEPPLKKTDFNDIPGRVAQASSGGAPQPPADSNDAAKEDFKGRQFSVVEIAARDIFGELVVSLPRETPISTLLRASYTNREPLPVVHIDRQPRIRQDLESSRHSLYSLRCRPV